MSSVDTVDHVGKAVKKAVLALLGSGVIVNAVYIFGLGYREGYLEKSGFDVSLFEVSWSVGPFWAYIASLHLSTDSWPVVTSVGVPEVLATALFIYMFVRLWVEAAKPDNGRTNTSIPKLRFRRLVAWKRSVRRRAIWVYWGGIKPIEWLLISERAFFAFLASYTFATVLAFLPVVSALWLYFPYIAVSYGERKALEAMSTYEAEGLCGRSSSEWSECVTFHVERREGGPVIPVSGRVIVRDGSLIGLLTDDGPVSLTLPTTVYIESIPTVRRPTRSRVASGF